MRVVRRLGSTVTHVVTVPVALIKPAVFLGSPFTAVITPVSAECGAVLRDPAGGVVCVRPGLRVRCRACWRATGISEARVHNHEVPGGRP